MEKKQIHAPVVVKHLKANQGAEDVNKHPLADLYRIVGKVKGYGSLPEECVVITSLDTCQNFVAETSQFLKEFDIYQESEAEIDFINKYIEGQIEKVAGPIYSRKLQLYFEKTPDGYRCMTLYHMDIYNLSVKYKTNQSMQEKYKGSLIDMVASFVDLDNEAKFNWYLGNHPSEKCYAKGKTPYEALRHLRRNYEMLEGHIMRRPEGLWDKVKWFDALNAYADTSIIGLIDV